MTPSLEGSGFRFVLLSRSTLFSARLLPLLRPNEGWWGCEAYDRMKGMISPR
jgi:hypothetical protein